MPPTLLLWQLLLVRIVLGLPHKAAVGSLWPSCGRGLIADVTFAAGAEVLAATPGLAYGHTLVVHTALAPGPTRNHVLDPGIPTSPSHSNPVPSPAHVLAPGSPVLTPTSLVAAQ